MAWLPWCSRERQDAAWPAAGPRNCPDSLRPGATAGGALTRVRARVRFAMISYADGTGRRPAKPPGGAPHATHRNARLALRSPRGDIAPTAGAALRAPLAVGVPDLRSVPCDQPGCEGADARL